MRVNISFFSLFTRFVARKNRGHYSFGRVPAQFDTNDKLGQVKQ